MASPFGTQREVFLMSPPGPGWRLRGRANFRSGAAVEVDAGRAFDEWLCLARAIRDAGGLVVVLPSDDGMTGLPYCAEAGHPLAPADGDPRPRFLLPRMWAPHRAQEFERWAPLVESIGFRTHRPEAGFWEGQGDVASFRGTEILFVGGRTDGEGLASVRDHFSEDALVLELQQPAFHGNVAMLCIDSCDCIVVCPSLVVGDGMKQLEARFGAAAIVPITMEEARGYATNSLPIGNTLLAPSIAPPRILRALEERGMTTIALPMKELCEKAGGASRCLVCRVPASIAAQLSEPDDLGEADLEALAAQRLEAE